MKQICITRGLVALVDDCDFESLSKFKWCASKGNSTFYAVRKERTEGNGRTTVKMHRQILGLSKGDGIYVDHRNHNGLDNRRENLRACTLSQNSCNQHIQIRPKSSQYKGVCWDNKRNKWRALIAVNRKRIYLGWFTSEIEAAKAYDQAAVKHHGEFAYVNFPK
jgi:hypothetical protein